MAIRNPCGATRRPVPEGPERCGLPRSLTRPRNDVVIWWPVLLFGSGGHRGGTARGRSLRSEFHTPSVSQRPVERAQWCDSTTGLPERIVRGDSPPQNKRTTRGEGGPFIRFRRGGPESIGRGIRSQALSNLTLHIIAKSRSFDNLWKVKLTLDFFRYVWKKKPEFATKW